MLISYSHRFIFVHIYKVAGTSIRATLKPYSYDPDVFLPVRLLRMLGVHNLARHHRLHRLRGHATAREIKEALSPKIFDRFYKFAFVRNPWDWQVSLYHFALKDPSHRQHELFKTFESYEKYIEWRVAEDLHLQKDFVTDENGELMVDFIGRYETLDRDFKEVCERVGVEYQLPHLNKTPRKNYDHYYTPRAAALVAEAFKEDIELFGYDFGGLKNSDPIVRPAERERHKRGASSAQPGM